jgi:hypothetical protein
MRHLYRSLLATLLLAAIAILGETRSAQAQDTTTCCTFTIMLSNIFPCPVPFTVKTSWDGTIQSDVMNAKGTPTTFNIPNCSATPHILDSVLVGTTWVIPGTPLPWLSGPINICGGCTHVGVSQNATTGCLEIRLTGC